MARFGGSYASSPLHTVKLPSVAAVLACLVISRPAAADTDYSDLWWNPDESGWGVGLQRQGDVLFLTLFVYGADGASTWFVAPDVRPLAASTTSWQGALYRATGPGFAAAYDNGVQASEAGGVSLEFTGPSSATLQYSVGEATVTRQIARMTWRAPSPAGSYHGGFTSLVAQCGDATRVGANDFFGALNVAQAGSRVTATITSTSVVAGLPSVCTFTADAAQTGRLAAWSGTFNCNLVIGLDDRGENEARTLRTGSFSLERIAVTPNGFHGALAAADQDCEFTGYFGGVRIP